MPCRFMDLRIIAEGAETKEQVDFLQGIGCDYAQGYYFYRPMSTEALEQLLSQDGIVDYRGVLNPSMELIDVNALLHDDMVSRAAVNNLIGGLACTPCTRPFRAAASEQRVLPRHRMQLDRSARTTEPDLAPSAPRRSAPRTKHVCRSVRAPRHGS